MSMPQIGTIVFLRRGDEVLLAMKKRGFGAGRWNGAGGKPKPDETVEQAAIRECQEEIGVTPRSLEQMAEIRFHYPEGKVKQWHGFVYICREWEGEPRETEEMAPRWFQVDEVPFEEMWDDDRYWLPQVLAGERVAAEFTFDAEDRVTAYEVRPG